MNIIINQNQIYRGFTEDPNFDLTTIEGGDLCSMVEIGQEDFDILLTDIETKEMQWNGVGFVEADNIEYLQSKKCNEALVYYETRKEFSFNGNPCWVTKEALRSFWIDLLIHNKDVEINAGSACLTTLNWGDLIKGVVEDITPSLAEEMIIKLQCYHRNIDSTYKQHCDAILLITDSGSLDAYDIQASYPEIPSFNGGSP